MLFSPVRLNLAPLASNSGLRSQPDDRRTRLHQASKRVRATILRRESVLLIGSYGFCSLDNAVHERRDAPRHTFPARSIPIGPNYQRTTAYHCLGNTRHTATHAEIAKPLRRSGDLIPERSGSGEVGERLVGLGHAVDLLASGHRLTLAAGGVPEFLAQPVGHRAAALSTT